MALWKDIFVPEEVLLALRDSNFTTPTNIQSMVLPHAIRDRLDIVGAAETVSQSNITTISYHTPSEIDWTLLELLKL